MEILCGVAAKIAALFIQPTVAPITQWLCYSFYYDRNIKTMGNQLEILISTKESVQNSVDFATRNGEEIEARVTTWLKKVDETREEARKVLPVGERVQTRCSNGACLNLMWRHQLSRKAKKIVKVIGELLENGNFEKVSYRPATLGIMSRRQMDYVDFVSRMPTAKGLMEALGDANINVIGVWGMGGAGKTTLVIEVAKQAKEKNLFDEVAMADVTQSPDLIRIQGQIADMLDLKFDAESVNGRADRLRQRLTKHKKILVILDDIWGKLDLEEIGIPSKGCKLILASRDKNVLSHEMGTDKDFGLDVLPEKEAWNLFEKMAGDCVITDPNLRDTAIAVAKECAGLPFALVTVSKALKDKKQYEWNNALQQLRRPAPGHLTKMQATIYSSIELSYSHLESEELKYVFLLCSEMDYTINYRVLLKYCYGLGSFHDITTLEEARDKIYCHVHNLKDSSLLLDCPLGSDDHCHMHDVVRDVATIIATDRKMFVVRDNSGLTKLPNVGSLKRCTTLSIPGGDIHELPIEMKCPKLRFFYVYGGDRSLQIPDNLFKGMGNLQVLDLTKMKLPSLPSSLGLLTNLQALCLDRCELADIAVIGKLKNLVILSLFHSEMSQLPT
jgi:hypothetical protein